MLQQKIIDKEKSLKPLRRNSRPWPVAYNQKRLMHLDETNAVK